MPQKLSIQQFAAQIKAKYPDYASVPDDELVRRITFKYPDYLSVVQFDAPPAPYEANDPRLVRDYGPTQYLGYLASRFRDVLPSIDRGSGVQTLEEVSQQLPGEGDVVGGLVRGAVMGPVHVAQGAAHGDAGLAAQGASETITGTLPAVYGARGAATSIRDALGSKARAGAKFDQVMQAAKDVPINTAEAESVLARAQELRSRGSTMPKVLNDFAKNRKAATGDFMGQPVTEPMTYGTGRDFASNAGAMSTREITAMNAKMQSQVAKFGEAMKTANRDAAVKVGMGDVYDAAMKEYAKAASLEAKRQILTKHLVKWGGPAIFGAGLIKLYSDLSD